MILGIGNDLCDIRRIEKSIERYGDRFLLRVFTEEERRKALSRAHPARTFAKRLGRASLAGFISAISASSIRRAAGRRSRSQAALRAIWRN
jgi:hypothetical protein